MVVKVSVTGVQQAQVDIKKAISEFMTNKFVTVGIHEDEGNHENDDITNASLGATLHFGADIDHPGGTSYGYSSKEDADKGKVRFLKRGAGYASLGETKPHKIRIPPRPWLDVGVASGHADYLKIISSELENGTDPEKILDMLGVVAASKVQQFMDELKAPPNAASTIKKKKSSNPLIDKGALKQSVTYKITDSKPSEGL